MKIKKSSLGYFLLCVSFLQYTLAMESPCKKRKLTSKDQTTISTNIENEDFSNSNVENLQTLAASALVKPILSIKNADQLEKCLSDFEKTMQKANDFAIERVNFCLNQNFKELLFKIFCINRLTTINKITQISGINSSLNSFLVNNFNKAFIGFNTIDSIHNTVNEKALAPTIPLINEEKSYEDIRTALSQDGSYIVGIDAADCMYFFESRLLSNPFFTKHMLVGLLLNQNYPEFKTSNELKSSKEIKFKSSQSRGEKIALSFDKKLALLICSPFDSESWKELILVDLTMWATKDIKLLDTEDEFEITDAQFLRNNNTELNSNVALITTSKGLYLLNFTNQEINKHFIIDGNYKNLKISEDGKSAIAINQNENSDELCLFNLNNLSAISVKKIIIANTENHQIIATCISSKGEFIIAVTNTGHVILLNLKKVTKQALLEDLIKNNTVCMIGDDVIDEEIKPCLRFSNTDLGVLLALVDQENENYLRLIQMGTLRTLDSKEILFLIGLNAIKQNMNLMDTDDTEPTLIKEIKNNAYLGKILANFTQPEQALINNFFSH